MQLVGFSVATFRTAGTALAVAIHFILLAGCGRYSSPIPPEATSPKAVEFVTVEGQEQGIVFTWIAPEQDRRGNVLKKLDGFRVMRKELPDVAAPLIDEEDFEAVADVPDNSLQRLQDLKEAARRGGKPFLRMKLTGDQRRVQFVDSSLRQGGVYIYKIVPYNHWFIDGETAQFVRVIFKGLGSDVAILKREDVLLESASDSLNKSDFATGSGRLFQ